MMQRQLNRQSGFNLIELSVLLIITTLMFYVALSSFSTAQTNTDISQAKANLKSISTGLENYKLDLGAYPWQNGSNAMMAESIEGSTSRNSFPTLERLTTPIAYIAGTPPFYDPFVAEKYYAGPNAGDELTLPVNNPILSQCYWYSARNAKDTSTWGQNMPWDEDPVWYYLESAGPDLHRHQLYQFLNPQATDSLLNRSRCVKLIYDSTNGTMSGGSIWQVGGVPEGTGTSFAYVNKDAENAGVSNWRNY